MPAEGGANERTPTVDESYRVFCTKVDEFAKFSKSGALSLVNRNKATQVKIDDMQQKLDTALAENDDMQKRSARLDLEIKQRDEKIANLETEIAALKGCEAANAALNL